MKKNQKISLVEENLEKKYPTFQVFTYVAEGNSVARFEKIQQVLKFVPQDDAHRPQIETNKFDYTITSACSTSRRHLRRLEKCQEALPFCLLWASRSEVYFQFVDGLQMISQV